MSGAGNSYSRCRLTRKENSSLAVSLSLENCVSKIWGIFFETSHKCWNFHPNNTARPDWHSPLSSVFIPHPPRRTGLLWKILSIYFLAPRAVRMVTKKFLVSFFSVLPVWTFLLGGNHPIFVLLLIVWIFKINDSLPHLFVSSTYRLRLFIFVFPFGFYSQMKGNHSKFPRKY